MYSSYLLKDKFQALLTPLMHAAIKLKLSANMITVIAFLVSTIYAVVLAVYNSPGILMLLPVVFLLKISLNALDGMVARHTQTISVTGAVLNDIFDVLSDALLFSAVFIVVDKNLLWLVIIIMVFVIEYSALVVQSITNHRPTDGPFGKSDRAIFLSAMAIALSFFATNEIIINICAGLAILLAVVTIFNRLKRIQPC